MTLPGAPLTRADLDKLAACGIDRALAEQALLRRVASVEGAALMGRNGGGDYSGVLFPYVWPGDGHVREYRLRRDHPELEYRDGRPQERNKYLSPPGRRNMLYFAPGADPAWLADTNLPLVISEGEKKALALWRCAFHESAEPRFLPAGLPGVWNWRGTIGKAPGPDGDRRDVKGAIPDLNRIEWNGRKVLIAFDLNVRDNDSVQAARRELTKELERRGAKVSWFEWPEDTPAGVNGVDDLVGAWGVERVVTLIEQVRGRTGSQMPDLLKFSFSDLGNAERLIALHGDDLRYCYAFRKWLVWDGRRWITDEGNQARKLGQETMLAFARQAMEGGNEAAAKFAGKCLNSTHITYAFKEAECHLVVAVEDLDTHPHLLNFENGTLDLRAGELREHRRADLITKLVRHRYNPDATCPTFLRFLNRILSGPLVDWTQKAFGYSLTGITSEKAVFICHGSGNNGKTTLLSTFLNLLEEYGVLLQIDTLMVRQESNNTQADLADLRGARFVMTSETEEGQRLAEGKLKRITQGMGKIKAVRKYENPVAFSESHKLWLDANHKPVVKGTDNAIWNRLKPIPFNVTIPPEKIDRELPGKLLSEAEGILVWAVEGARRWFAEGLGTPADVASANQAWRMDSDQIRRFIDECCVTGDYAQAKARQLYGAYKQWAEDCGERPVRESEFAYRVMDRGFKREHTKTGNVYRGIGVRDGER